MAATPLAYVAAQFVFGTSLAADLRDGRGRPALGQVLDITAQIAAALDAAHGIERAAPRRQAREHLPHLLPAQYLE